MSKIRLNIYSLRYILIWITLAILSISVFAQMRSVDDFDRLFIQTQSMFDNGKYEDVIQFLDGIPSNELQIADDTTKVLYNTLYGKACLLIQNNEQAEYHLEKAVALYERLRFKYPSYIDMLVFRAYASDALGKRDEAAKWYRKAILKGKVVDHNLDLDNCCYLNLGNIYNETGNYNLAQEYYSKIQWIDSLQKVEIHGDYYGKVADRFNQISALKDWTRAKAVNDSLTNYCLTKYGEQSEFYLCCLQSEGSIQHSLGDFDMAIIPYNETLRICKKYGLCNYFTGYAYCRLIEFYCNQNKVDEAISLFPEAISHIKILSNDGISEVEPCLFIGMACVRNEDYESGIMALEKFLTYTPDYMQWGVPYAINKLTWAYLNVGRNQEVLDLLLPLLSRGETLPDNFQSLRPYLHKTLGCSYYVMKHKENAIANLNEAIRLSEGDMANDTLIQEILSEYENQ